MKKYVLVSLSLTLSAFIGAAQADHNSPWGEGWANMTNDIHNTRIDTMDDDTDTFTDFVRYGAGASTDNRFDTDDDTIAAVGRGGSQGGMQSGRNR